MEDMFDRLGDILRDRLNSDEDPFKTEDTFSGRTRQAGNIRGRMPPPLKAKEPDTVPVPVELIDDFLTLGLPSGTRYNECKARWKELLKQYHPDKGPIDSKKIKDNTIKVINITRSWRRIDHWFQTGKLL